MLEINKSEVPTLFVIDKDSFTRHKLLKVLPAAGFSVSVFQDIDTLLVSVSASFPAAVLVVDKSGDFDVAKLCARIKPLNELLPLVLLSYDTDVKHAVDVIRQGASELVEMPFIDRILIEKINAVLGR